MTVLAICIMLATLCGAIFLSYKAWTDWHRRLPDAAQRGWRKLSTTIALFALSLSVLMFTAYTFHNVLVGGDQGLTPLVTLIIKTGNSLSVLAVIFGLAGRGSTRWATVAGGCCTLFLWFWQGITL